MSNGELAPDVDPFTRFERLERLGEGSHGAVWKARQSSPQRLVALKILDASFSGSALATRFRREIELLAMLEHPGISRLYESGTTQGPSGPVPWLAMEYVEGQPLDAWAATGPRLRERVLLLESLCRAAHFAHTRGVVHRDLKPSNVLVDVQQQPRIIDFGIASALARGDLTRMTRAGSVLGTLPWMSPEQLDGRVAADPRWDVYALGVIAYELIAGVLPYPGLSDASSVTAAVRILGEQAPVPLGRIAADARGELETVVMKAIARDPDDRYGSAAELAEDLRRWREGRPVEAAPPGALRVMRLFVRRHRALSWSVAAVAVVLVAATAVALHLALSEARARQQAELRLAERDAVNAFLGEMLRSADPEQGAGNDIRVREWLATTDAGYQSRAGTLPAQVRQSLARTLGTALLNLGEPDLARPRLEESVALAVQLHGPRAPDNLGVEIELARANATRDPESTETDLRALQARARASGDAVHEVEAGIALVSLMDHQGRIDDALVVSSQALERARQALPDDAPAALTAMHNHAAMLKYRGDFAAAETLAREVHQRRNAALGPAHPLTLYSLNQLAGIVDRLGRADEAEAMYREAHAARRQALGERHPSTLVTLNNLSALLIQRGKLDEAGPLLDELVQATTERFGSDAPLTLMAMNQRGYVLEDLGRLEDAEVQLRAIVAVIQQQGGDVHPERLAPRSNLAMLLSKRGKHAEAIATMQATVGDAAEALGQDHPYVGIFRSNYGQILADAGQRERAVRELRAAQAVLESRMGPEHARTRKNRERLQAAGAAA